MYVLHILHSIMYVTGAVCLYVLHILHSMMYVTGAVCMYVLHILHSMVYVTGAVCLYVQKEGHSIVWCRGVRREELFPRCPHSKCVFTYVVDNKGGDGGMCTCCVFIWINGLSNGGIYGKVPLLSLSSPLLSLFRVEDRVGSVVLYACALGRDEDERCCSRV